MNRKPEINKMTELPVVPTTIGDMSFNRTGLWRYLMPVIRDRAAPCQKACPLGMPSPDFINGLLKKDAAEALGRIMKFNPLPGITGRLCYHPCQAKCLRRELDGAVQIQKLERYLADATPDPEMPTPEECKGRVAVLGAGPLGLSAAYFLGRAGLAVTVFDPLDRAGGFLTGLDEDRLPEDVLTRETKRLADSAKVQLKLGNDFNPQDAGNPGQGWSLIIHDRTAHADKSGPRESLAKAAGQWGTGCSMLDTEGVCPSGGYKASQVASAVADGRALALEALVVLELTRKSRELREMVQAGQAGEVIGKADIRYEMFEPQAPVTAEAKNGSFSEAQALKEAERCLSCGHCNLCGRCLVFCPDVSLSVNGQDSKPQIDEMHCKGCGICAHECPRQAIVMEN